MIAIPKIDSAGAKTILLVEDEAMIRNFAVAALRRQGYIVLPASDGIEGSMLFARQFAEIDLLVTDISLPGMRGPELAAYVRKTRADLKILFASGSVQFEDRNPADIFEGSAFLAKPFTMEQLVESVNALFQMQSAPSSAVSLSPLKEVVDEARI
jgi:two-component system cell cycle sensor histidine kinase/response regulator CckA